MIQLVCDVCAKTISSTYNSEMPSGDYFQLRLSDQGEWRYLWVFCTMRCLQKWISKRAEPSLTVEVPHAD